MKQHGSKTTDLKFILYWINMNTYKANIVIQYSEIVDGINEDCVQILTSECVLIEWPIRQETHG